MLTGADREVKYLGVQFTSVGKQNTETKTLERKELEKQEQSCVSFNVDCHNLRSFKDRKALNC